LGPNKQDLMFQKGHLEAVQMRCWTQCMVK
jgi:hypothetical protein